ncbi:hypothetical protein L1987_60406 [Smallanthus sonchifolius]|uniref:Uncharacterized protein n=1 Tax=Smallanthus sonchifolius TaxID=185202 RepID=A0ACB9D835_9ASTR|nr:hypothetical protein L1987_60406 [Smallanthus sonchifolius]
MLEWNWFGNGNNPTHLLLSESTGDSEEVKSDVYHEHEEDGGAMDEQEGVLFRFNDEDDVDDDDDAQSCSYDHSSYINTRHGNSRHHDDDDDDDGSIEDDDEDDDKNKNRCETKMDSSKQQWRSCVDPSKQREIDRKFWETCLAS